ncbi:hypothetical protein [Sphingomonas sp.]|uniref:hypothetical protein n=1 Tax=Sphingomonas sp. TaxID=28214 RepID=UPI001B119E57|nr:hypothetical protein [Sphingomonas sp.]MBO9714122.1 hypothetical protein [Sphingomonas sp.]
MSDEIAGLSRGFLELPGGTARLDEEIERAEAEARWEELGKWHRVRLRLHRFQREQRNAELLGLVAAGD